MQRCSAALGLSVMLVLSLVLSGCGGSGSPSREAVARVSFSSPAITSHAIPARYTCDGENTNPPLEWGAVPKDTGELVLTAIGLTPTKPVSNDEIASIEWAIAGIKPSLHKLDPGEIPQGAHVGQSADERRHYNVCPKKGTTEEYQFMLYGVPVGAKVSPGFADAPILSALGKPGTATSASAIGAFDVIYKRK
jgi:phosphatidylethanolamine-binding protein (PEBP) family uncharacterized protein